MRFPKGVHFPVTPGYASARTGVTHSIKFATFIAIVTWFEVKQHGRHLTRTIPQKFRDASCLEKVCNLQRGDDTRVPRVETERNDLIYRGKVHTVYISYTVRSCALTSANMLQARSHWSGLSGFDLTTFLKVPRP